MNDRIRKPPVLFVKILNRLIDWRVNYDALGDYEAKYYSISNKSGYTIAVIWSGILVLDILSLHKKSKTDKHGPPISCGLPTLQMNSIDEGSDERKWDRKNPTPHLR